MAIKIKNISIKGIRGIKDTIQLPLEGKSIILYGDNGTGKSSISDCIEWLYTDKVSHLSSSEIDLKSALRNSDLSLTDVASISITFNNPDLNTTKSLSCNNRGKITPAITHSHNNAREYFSTSKQENLILRYQHLRNFVDKTKSEKLGDFFDIIGYSEVTKVKDILRKGYNSIKADIKTKNFEAQINTQKETLVEKIGALVSLEKDFVNAINEITKDFKLDITIQSIHDIDEVLSKLKILTNTDIISTLSYLNTIQNTLNTLENELNLVNLEYSGFYNAFISFPLMLRA